MGRMSMTTIEDLDAKLAYTKIMANIVKNRYESVYWPDTIMEVVRGGHLTDFGKTWRLSHLLVIYGVITEEDLKDPLKYYKYTSVYYRGVETLFKIYLDRKARLRECKTRNDPLIKKIEETVRYGLCNEIKEEDLEPLKGKVIDPFDYRTNAIALQDLECDDVPFYFGEDISNDQCIGKSELISKEKVFKYKACNFKLSNPQSLRDMANYPHLFFREFPGRKEHMDSGLLKDKNAGYCLSCPGVPLIKYDGVSFIKSDGSVMNDFDLIGNGGYTYSQTKDGDLLINVDNRFYLDETNKQVIGDVEFLLKKDGSYYIKRADWILLYKFELPLAIFRSGVISPIDDISCKSYIRWKLTGEIDKAVLSGKIPKTALEEFDSYGSRYSIRCTNLQTIVGWDKFDYLKTICYE
jgi:hypothetical protein